MLGYLMVAVVILCQSRDCSSKELTSRFTSRQNDGEDSDERPEACNMDLVRGLCNMGINRYGYLNGECVKFIWSGCNGNDNNFRTKEQCEEVCKPEKKMPEFCSLVNEVGFCRPHFWRFHFDAEQGICRSFLFGGYDGNENNFATREECMQMCRHLSNRQNDGEDSNERPEYCNMNLDSGICTWYEPVLKYGYRNGECVEFTSGGCQARNANRFDTKEACENVCKHNRMPRLCSLPKQAGTCKPDYRRFYFDAERGICRPFHYGGHGGNENNFRTKAQCINTCVNFS